MVAEVIKANSDVPLSNPKKPSLADPSKYLNSIPLSLPSFDAGAVSPPRVNTGSSIVTVVELTVEVVPLTVRLPVTIKLDWALTSPATVKSPCDTVLPLSVSIVNLSTAPAVCTLKNLLSALTINWFSTIVEPDIFALLLRSRAPDNSVPPYTLSPPPTAKFLPIPAPPVSLTAPSAAYVPVRVCSVLFVNVLTPDVPNVSLI